MSTLWSLQAAARDPHTKLETLTAVYVLLNGRATLAACKCRNVVYNRSKFDAKDLTTFLSFCSVIAQKPKR